MPIKPNLNKKVKLPIYYKKRRPNGDLILIQRQRIQILPFLFLGGFCFIWYKGLLYDQLDFTRPLILQLKELFFQEPFILIFVLAPLIFCGLIFKSHFGSSQNRYIFKLNEHALFLGNKRLYDFNEIEKISTSFQENDIGSGVIRIHPENGNVFVIYRSYNYNELSITANEIATVLHVLIDS